MSSATVYFRRWGKPTLEATIFRCRSIGSCRTLPGPRDTPAASRHQHQALYRGPQAVLLLNVSAAAAQGGGSILVTSAPVDEW